MPTGSSGDVHRAIRRFEFGVHLAEPEEPRQMYEEETYGMSERRTPSPRATNLLEGDTELVARFVLRGGRVIVEMA